MSERQVEVHMEGCWIPTDMESIREGELFRMFEPDGTPVEDREGNSVFRAISDSYFSSKAAAWTVAVE